MRRANDTRGGMLIALMGFAILPFGDAIVKSLAGLWPGAAVGALRFMIGAAGLGLLVWWRQGASGLIIRDWPVQLLRGLGLGMGAGAFFTAVHLMPLADATAVVFVGPMITSVLSTVFLRERAPPAVWVSIAIAFVGVLVILQPEVTRLGLVALLPLGSAFGMSLLMIGNRLAAGTGSALQLQFSVAVVTTVVLSLLALAAHLAGFGGQELSAPSATVVARCTVIALFASTAHWLIFRATERASAAVVAPMTYVQLLIASVLGWMFFDDAPDGSTLAGAALIIVAGLYLWRSQTGAGGLAKPEPIE